MRDGLATGKMERTRDVINHSNKGVLGEVRSILI